MRERAECKQPEVIHEKKCTKCSETKAVELFPKYPKSDLPRARCIQCVRTYAKEYGIKNRAKRTAQSRIRRWKKRGLDGPPEPYSEPSSKICTKCGEEKEIELFTVNYRNGRRKGECKACALVRSNAWRSANKEAVNARGRERSKGAKQRVQAAVRMKRYKANHPDKVRADKRKWNARQKKRRMQFKAEIKAASSEQTNFFSPPVRGSFLDISN